MTSTNPFAPSACPSVANQAPQVKNWRNIMALRSGTADRAGDFDMGGVRRIAAE
jgi:hypothetical protein